MTIQENLELLQNTKEAIYTAIESMGGTISSSTPFSGYADAIMTIPQDGGGDEPCDPCDDTSECYDQLECDCSNDYCSDPECPGYDPMECDPCMADPCSDPECGAYDPVACGECEDNPCASPGCVEYDECQCEGNCGTKFMFTLSQGQRVNVDSQIDDWDDPCTNDDNRTRTVKIYTDPADSPVNSIEFTLTCVAHQGYDYYDDTDNTAGVVGAAMSVINNIYCLGLACQTAGTYWIELDGYDSTTFYDSSGNEMTPEN